MVPFEINGRTLLELGTKYKIRTAFCVVAAVVIVVVVIDVVVEVVVLITVVVTFTFAIGH